MTKKNTLKCDVCGSFFLAEEKLRVYSNEYAERNELPPYVVGVCRDNWINDNGEVECPACQAETVSWF